MDYKLKRKNIEAILIRLTTMEFKCKILLVLNIFGYFYQTSAYFTSSRLIPRPATRQVPRFIRPQPAYEPSIVDKRVKVFEILQDQLDSDSVQYESESEPKIDFPVDEISRTLVKLQEAARSVPETKINSGCPKRTVKVTIPEPREAFKENGLYAMNNKILELPKPKISKNSCDGHSEMQPCPYRKPSYFQMCYSEPSRTNNRFKVIKPTEPPCDCQTKELTTRQPPLGCNLCKKRFFKK